MNGFINVLKPPGLSSAQVVGVVKRIFGVKKAGHTGTLDPAAAGVLPLCIGRATKFSEYVMRGEKEYIAEITFGLKTDTLDSAGKITGRDDTLIEEQRLKDELALFIGKIEQTVPAYSAVKQNGAPLYKAAIKNQISSLPKRDVIIKNAQVLYGANNRYMLKIECSKGTYIRSLIEELGGRLNTFAYTSFLLRTRNGNFKIENSYTIDELEDGTDKSRFLISADDALDFMPKLVLKDYLFDIATTGSPIDLMRAKLNLSDNQNYRVYCKNKFLGVGRAERGELKLKAVYYLRGQ